MQEELRRHIQDSFGGQLELQEYIRINFSSQREFAKMQGVLPQQITPWIRDKFIVVNGVLYSPRRTLIEHPSAGED